jgi:hypothetical protein
MTIKQLIRKRNILVQIAVNLKAEDLKAVNLAIQIIDSILDNK